MVTLRSQRSGRQITVRADQVDLYRSQGWHPVSEVVPVLLEDSSSESDEIAGPLSVGLGLDPELEVVEPVVRADSVQMVDRLGGEQVSS